MRLEEAAVELPRVEDRCADPDWLAGEGQDERRAILAWQRGQMLTQGGQLKEAVQLLEQTARSVPDDAERLRELIGEAMDALAGKLLWPEDASTAQYSPQAERLLEQVVVWLPQQQNGWYRLGVSKKQSGKLSEAIAAYEQAIALDPKSAVAFVALAAAYRRAGDEAAYQRQVAVARPLVASLDEYNRACFAAICDEVEEALALLAQAIAKAPHYRILGQRDADFDFIRDDPRFQALVGGTQ